MKKVALINCYSDFNKGDLGILLATIECLRKIDSNIELNAVSSFTFEDPYFKTHHEELKRHVSEVYPTIVGRLFGSSKIKMLFKMFVDFLKMSIIYFAPYGLFRMSIFNKLELRTLNLIQNSDLIISKGGSFICNERGLIGSIRFFREMSIIVASLRLNKNVIIWGQSIGPVYGFFSLKLVNWILLHTKLVVLREEECAKKYQNIKFRNNTVTGYDLAFSLSAYPVKRRKTSNTVGLTVKRFKSLKEDELYTSVITETIEYIISKYNKTILIIPHVTIDDDLSKALEIYVRIKDKYKNKILIFSENYSVQELLDIYSNIDLLIGTRLHSTIFAMCMDTEVINISYHGTKSSGVFNSMNLANNVMEGKTIDSVHLKNAIDDIIESPTNSVEIRKMVKEAHERNLEIAKIILED